MKMIKCCQNCKARVVGCHSECKQYLKEKEEYNKQKQRIDKAKDLENDLTSFAVNKQQRLTR